MKKMKSALSTFLMCLIFLFAFSVTSVVSAQDGTWSTKTPMPSANTFPKGAVVNDIFYVMKTITWPFPYPPDQALYAYNPVTDQWSSKIPMPTPRNCFGIGVVDGKIYTVGGWLGWDTAATVEAYNPATDEWITGLTPMPKPRPYLGAGVVEGILYTIGGYIPWVGITDTVEAYNPATDTWTTDLTPMPTARQFVSIGVVDGIIYAVGGYDVSGSSSSKVEAYDPSSNTWTNKATMPTSRQPAVEVIDGILYAIGGNNSTNGLLDTVEAYDPKTDIWTTVTSMPTKRENPASGVVGRTLYVAGGHNDSGPLAMLEAFTPYYIFGGFLPPVSLDKPFKLGSTIPVKFQLTNSSGTFITTAVATITLQKYTGELPVGDPMDAISTSGADTGNRFRYSDNHYIYNLNTKGLSTGTWQIKVAIDDGSVQTKFISLK